MEKKTKIILWVAAIAGVAYVTRDKWMPTKEKAEESSGFLGLSFGKKKKNTGTITSKQYKPTSSKGTCPKGMSKVNVAAPNQLPDYRCRYND